MKAGQGSPAPGHADPGRVRSLILPVGLVMAAALAIRLYGLGAPSLWLDEAYSVWFSSQGWSYLWTEVPRFETHPSFYYSLLKLWRVFGSDEFTLRLLSVAINVAAIPFVALTARHCVGGERGCGAAVLAAILFACSATQVHAAQEARPYALMTLGIAVALASAVAVMAAGARAEAPMGRLLARDRPMVLAFAGIGIGIALLGWSHNYGLVFGMILGACLFGWWLVRGAPRGLLANLLMSVVLALVLYGPNLPIALMQTRSLNDRGFWLQAPGIRTAVNAMLEMPLGHGNRLAAALSLVLVAAGLAGMVRSRPRVPLAIPVTLLVMATVPAALSFVLSRVGQPIFLFRTLQPSQVPMLAALACAPFAVGPLFPARARWMAPALPLLLAAVALWHAMSGRQGWPDEDWRAITKAIGAASAPAVPRLVIYPAESELPFLYYAPRLGIAMDITTVPGPYPARRADYAYPAGNGGSPGMTPEMAADAIARLKGENRVWIVTRFLQVYDPGGLFMAGMEREFPCLIDDSLPRIQLRGRADADGGCPDG